MRNGLLCYAHIILFDESPDLAWGDWQVAARVMEGFDLRLMGRDLAKKCIFEVCNRLGQPISREEQDVIEIALHNGREYFWPQIPFEVLLSQMPVLEEMEITV